MARSYCRFMSNFITHHQSVFQNAWIILKSHQPSIRVPVALNPCQNLVLILIYCNFWWLCRGTLVLAVLILISWMTISVCLWTIFMSSFVKWHFKYFAHFEKSVYFSKSYYCIIRVLYIFWLQVLCQVCNLQIFSLCTLSFHSFHRAKVFNLMTSTLAIIFFYGSSFWSHV